MPDWYMLTLVGRDQPGIVAEISSGLFNAGFQLGETSMMRLGGNFTMMLMVCCEVKNDNGSRSDDVYIAQQLESQIKDLGLHLHIDPIEAHLHKHLIPNLRVSVYGADRPGIVAKVTRILQQNEFNILDLESDVGGTDDQPIYVMNIEGQADIEADVLQQALSLADAEIDLKVYAIDTLIA